MKIKANSKGALVTGIFAALAASSCCIPPFIALIAGVGGGASTLSWMEPFRPYLIGFAILSIGYAWYKHLKPLPKDDCGCSIEKPRWYQTKGFLIGMTVFAILSIGFPYFSHYLHPNIKKNVPLNADAIVTKVNLNIEGMTCASCEYHINYAVHELNGIRDITTSYESGTTIIVFDARQTSIQEITKTINQTGYTVKKN